MKEEIKTLKDFGSEVTDESFPNGKFKKFRMYEDAELKAEAVKILNSDTIDFCKYLDVGGLSQSELFILERFIKKFFLTTSQELKNEI